MEEDFSMTISIENIGFIGLGRIGAPLAQNILKAGYHLTVYNRTQEKAAPLAEAGAKVAGSPKEAATGADVVFTSLMDDQSMFDCVLETDGILAGLKPGGIHIGMATISPSCAGRLAELHKEHGTHYIACPVVGRPPSAVDGTMTLYVAGDKDLIDQCRPLLSSFATNIIWVSADHKVANSVKLANNFVVVALIELFGEVYTFAEKSGIDFDLMHRLLRIILDHPAIHGYVENIPIRNFVPAGFDLSSGFKDVQLMLQASTDVQSPLPFAGIAREKFLAAMANGMQDHDWSAIYEITRMNAGLE
jgi:3-hydroxyisobutyrate dehydrogenase-like beta-hydroxyacid dehydrogenase